MLGLALDIQSCVDRYADSMTFETYLHPLPLKTQANWYATCEISNLLAVKAYFPPLVAVDPLFAVGLDLRGQYRREDYPVVQVAQILVLVSTFGR